MDYDEMCSIRNAWISAEVEGVINGLLGPSRLEKVRHVLLSRAGHGNLSAALILAYIAFRDLHADSSEEIARRLQDKNLVLSVDMESVIQSLVQPVVRAVRAGKIHPITWWNVRDCFELLVELWAAERSLLYSPEEIRRDLIGLWDLRDKSMQDLILKNEFAPYMYLPDDLLELSPKGHLAVIANNVKARRVLQRELHEHLLGHPSARLDRPDLVEIVRRLWIRRRFEALLADVHMQEDVRTAVTLEFKIWDEQLNRCASALTAYELRLIGQADENSLYRRDLLSAIGNTRLEEFRIGEALPVRADLAREPRAAPPWIVDDVIAEGARNWHRWVGPYPVFLMTAETPLHEEFFRSLLKNETWKLGYATEDDVVHLYLFMSDECEDGDLRLTFSYSLASITAAWKLLHLAETGYIRLSALRLTDRGEVVVVGANTAWLPEKLRRSIRVNATQALRSLVGNDMNAVVQAFTTYDAGMIAIRALEICENAKGEDMIDELTSSSPPNLPEERWARFRNETRAVAQARAALAAARLDECQTAALEVALHNAMEEKQRALEVARNRRSPREAVEDRFVALAALLPDEETAFIHLTIVKGALYAACISSKNAQPFAEMRYLKVPVEELRKLGTAWALGDFRARAELTHNADSDGLTHLRNVAKSILASTPDTTKRLIISPVYPLDQLPLHAVPLDLNHEDTCLLDCFDEVMYAPSLNLISHLSKGQPAEGPPSLISHSGAGIPGFKPLTGPRLETMALSGLYPDARTLTEDSATRDAMLQVMTGARVVNFSGHAFSDADRWNSGLALAGSSLGSSILTSGHVLAHRGFGGVEVLTLNACRTAGPTSNTRALHTLRGIDGAFLARGVRSVVSTLWEVYDPCALVFSILLHASVAMGESAGKGYQRAIGYLRKSGWRNLYFSYGYAPECYLQDFLDEHRPQWHAELEAYGTDHLAVWGAFKITGAPW